MSKKAVRKGDRTTGTCYHPSHLTPLATGGTVVSHASTVYVEGKELARKGDVVKADCGHIGIIEDTSDAKVHAENKKATNGQDITVGDYKANIVSYASNTYIG